MVDMLQENRSDLEKALQTKAGKEPHIVTCLTDSDAVSNDFIVGDGVTYGHEERICSNSAPAGGLLDAELELSCGVRPAAWSCTVTVSGCGLPTSTAITCFHFTEGSTLI